jgi:hypothetical protein
MLKLRRVKTKCAVKGCRNSAAKVETFNLSASREFGTSVIMCEACIKGAFEAIEELKKAREAEAAEKEAAEKEAAEKEAAETSAEATEEAAETAEADTGEAAKTKKSRKKSEAET